MYWLRKLAAALGLIASVATAQAQSASDADQKETDDEVAKPPAAPYTLGAYVEAFYQWNFNEPSNQITNYRGFDNRSNTFTISNAALDAQWDYRDVLGHLTLQVGHTPSTYYSSEPTRAGASGANGTSAELWKYLQQANVGYRFADVISVSAGIFLSPIGPENMAIKDNWNWSRSDLFF
ncbi:MAG TPA: outer membrane beta-barrel protein, partial [Polyangiaceae bacterium]|nr:outer membrane beta-barrel protein [Polyangiaceae bacterium]